MSTEITIPSQLVAHARDAATHMLRKAGTEIMLQAERREPKPEEPLQRFDAFRALLLTLPTEPEVAAHVGIEHGPALREAMREHTTAHANIVATAHHGGDAAGWVQRATAELADLTAFMDSLETLDDERDTAAPGLIEWLQTAQGLVTRIDAWTATVERRDLRVRPGEGLWHWRIDHEEAGHVASGLCRSRDGATQSAESELRARSQLEDS